MDKQRCEQPDQSRIVALLSEESHVPLHEVAALYERERAALAVGPHVPNFLHVFAIRNVREMLRSWHEQANTVETMRGSAGAEHLDTACIMASRKDFPSNLEHPLAA